MPCGPGTLRSSFPIPAGAYSSVLDGGLCGGFRTQVGVLQIHCPLVFGPRGCGCIRRFLSPRVAREGSSCATASCQLQSRRRKQHHCKYFIRRSTRARPLLMSSLAATAARFLVGAGCVRAGIEEWCGADRSVSRVGPTAGFYPLYYCAPLGGRHQGYTH